MAAELDQLVRSGDFFARAGRISAGGAAVRAPELAPLATKTVAQFGLGCVGAPSALEFARAGIGNLRILDHDIVDPGTEVRWPFGLSAAGRKKVDVIADFVAREYPHAKVVTLDRKLGGVRTILPPGGSELDVLDKAVSGASLIYDATAEIGVQHLLSDVARDARLPYVCVDGTFGGWGGRVCCIRPGRTAGCWLCYQAAITDGTIEAAPAKREDGIQPPGCGDPTFTGAGFDLSQVALAGVRVAVSTLCEGAAHGYPTAHWDVLIISFRDGDGRLIAPTSRAYTLQKHPKCPRCGAV
jgi:molybdopterin/thiamine biosynthesis adenylyltransferase